MEFPPPSPLPNRIMEILDTVPRGFPCFLCQRTPGDRRIDDPSATIGFKNPKKEGEDSRFLLFEKDASRMDEQLAEEKFDLVKRSWLGSLGPLETRQDRSCDFGMDREKPCG